MSKRILPEYEKVGHEQMVSSVFQALGRASVCWEPMNGTGVFDSTTAKQVGEELMETIEQYLVDAHA